MGELESALRARRHRDGRAFVPYVTGGLPGVDEGVLRGLERAGADAVEVGIPFSDPVMDGGVIQEASRLALEAGARPRDVLETIRKADLGVPVAVMTYLNPIHRAGSDAFLDEAADAGVSAAIVPDLPVDEADEWRDRCAARGVEPVFLAAPGSSPGRLRRIAGASRGFVYCVAAYGVTGERDRLAETARALVGALRPMTDLPLLVGVGIGTPGQAAEACGFADGVVVGSALVRRLLERDAEGALALAGRFRAAVPSGGTLD